MKKEYTVSIDFILSNVFTLMQIKDHRTSILLKSYARLLNNRLPNQFIIDYVNACLSWQYDGADTFESLSEPLYRFKREYIHV